jgi:hypothetical protein
MRIAAQPSAQRAAAISLGVSAFLFAAFPLLRPFFPLDPRSSDALALAAPAITSWPWFLSHLLLLIAFLLLMLGMLGIHAMLVRSGEENRLLRALVLSLAGIALILPMVGVEIFAMPSIGRAFIAGGGDIAAAFGQIYRGPGIAVLLVGLVLLAVGGFGFAAAIRRSARASAWAGTVFAIGLALWCPLLPKPVRVVDGFLIGIGGIWLAWNMMQAEPDREPCLS